MFVERTVETTNRFWRKKVLSCVSVVVRSKSLLGSKPKTCWNFLHFCRLTQSMPATEVTTFFSHFHCSTPAMNLVKISSDLTSLTPPPGLVSIGQRNMKPNKHCALPAEWQTHSTIACGRDEWKCYETFYMMNIRFELDAITFPNVSESQ